MSQISAKDVAALRAKTGLGMMDCKNALVEAGGDIEAAQRLLREKGLATAAKKEGRIAAEGLVDILTEGGQTAIIEVNCETDFVAKNESFKGFVKGLLRTVLSTKPASVEELLAKPYDGSATTVESNLIEQIAVIGEKLSIRRFQVLDGACASYLHGGGVAGSVVAFKCDCACTDKDEFKQFGRNIAMQIASGTPAAYVSKEDVPAAVIEEEKKVLLAQIANDPANASKPPQVIEKMVSGRIEKYFTQNCLLEQSYIKDGDLTVGAYVAATAKELGCDIAVASFVLYEKGEGIEKKEEDFASEIAKMVGN
ncbi:MAG: translation elongation factor Ts [Oscillospiraceae bacterium]|nr:translation elongation factor Ts [Oscillospiraceae bacterium]